MAIVSRKYRFANSTWKIWDAMRSIYSYGGMENMGRGEEFTRMGEDSKTESVACRGRKRHRAAIA